MNVGTLLDYLTVFVLAILLGFEVISKVPATLHTPLMSGTNSIHGIVLVGAIGLAATADNPLAGSARLRGHGLRRRKRRRRLLGHGPHAADVQTTPGPPDRQGREVTGGSR